MTADQNKTPVCFLSWEPQKWLKELSLEGFTDPTVQMEVGLEMKKVEEVEKMLSEVLRWITTLCIMSDLLKLLSLPALLTTASAQRFMTHTLHG